MTLREKFELMECNCDADRREAVRAKFLERYGVEPPDLTLEEVMGDAAADVFRR